MELSVIHAAFHALDSTISQQKGRSMKLLLLLIAGAALVAPALSAAAADNASVAGKWHVHDSIAGNDTIRIALSCRKMLT